MENSSESNEVKFKSKLMEHLAGKYTKADLSEEEIKSMPKQSNTVNLSDILKDFEKYTEQDIENILSDINNQNIGISIDSSAIKILSDKNADQEKIQLFLGKIRTNINIDVNSISELSCEQLKDINSRCFIDKVYVNSGYDEAARDGYDTNKYMQIRRNADLMLNSALGKDKDKMSDLQKFKRIYKYIVDNTKYDYGEVGESCHDSRNLNNFFTKGRYEKNGQLKGKGRAICAGIADGLKNLCDCMGIESEYVQGYATKNNGTRVYHAWLRVKIDGKWYNADPTWDLGKVGIAPFSYCLKSDAEFRRDHNIDYNYNPTYTRGGQESKVTYRKQKTYTKSEESMHDAMKDLIDKGYTTKYSMSRASSNVAHKIYSPINEEELKQLTEKKIPVQYSNDNSLTLKQRLANRLYRGKHLKNIPFVRNFINKNSTIAKNTQNVNKVSSTQTNSSGLHRVDGKLKEAITRSSQSKASQTQSKER